MGISIIGQAATLTPPNTPTGLRAGEAERPAEPNPLNIPQRIKEAEDVRLYNERRGYVPGQGAVIGQA